jgi:uridine phosphorylase
MEAHFNPQDTIRHITSVHNLRVEELGVAPTVVISWGRSMVEALAQNANAVMPPHWIHRERQLFLTGEIGGKRVSFAQMPIGAPGTIMIMEEMIACGAQTFIGLGWAGSLQMNAPVGSLFIPTSCLSEEGTSAHYIDPGVEVHPDPELLQRISQAAARESAQVFEGRLWTIDAPYREMNDKVKKYREQGILGVDMETSAMYALGIYRRVRVCNLLIVSDELWHAWRPAFATPELEQANLVGQQVILRCLEAL